MSFLKNKTFIQWLITLGIPFIILLTPVSGLYTSEIRLFFAITVCVILMVSFEFFDVLIPAMLLPIAYYVTGLVPLNIAFGGWTQRTVYMVIGAFLLANILNETGLLKRIAFWCIKHTGGTFNGVLYGLYLVGILIAIISVNSGYAIVVTLAYGICKALDLGRSKASAVVMMTGATAALTVGVFLYRPAWAGLIQAGIQTVNPDFIILWQDFPMYNFPCVFFGLFYVFLLTKIYKTKDMGIGGTKEYFFKEYEKLGKMSVAEKKVLFLVTILLVWVLTSPIHGYPADYAFMVLPWIAFFPGIRIGTAQCVKNLNIGTIFFVVSCMGIATVGAHLGMTDLVSSVISPVAQEAGPLGLILAILILGVLANLVLTPLAMLSCLVPAVAQVCVDIGINPLVAVMAIVYTTDMYFLPHEVAALLLLYGFGVVKMSDFVKMASLKTVVLFIGFWLIQIPYYMFMGIL